MTNNAFAASLSRSGGFVSAQGAPAVILAVGVAYAVVKLASAAAPWVLRTYGGLTARSKPPVRPSIPEKSM